MTVSSLIVIISFQTSSGRQSSIMTYREESQSNRLRRIQLTSCTDQLHSLISLLSNFEIKERRGIWLFVYRRIQAQAQLVIDDLIDNITDLELCIRDRYLFQLQDILTEVVQDYTECDRQLDICIHYLTYCNYRRVLVQDSLVIDQYEYIIPVVNLLSK